MEEEMRKQINLFKNFINESKQDSWWYTLDEKLNILKSYIYILKNDYIRMQKINPEYKSKSASEGITIHDIALWRFTALYNYLIIERMFYPDVMERARINKILKLEKLNSPKDILNKFEELDNNKLVSKHIREFNKIPLINNYISKYPDIYDKLIKK
jgi:hypothetical protein